MAGTDSYILRVTQSWRGKDSQGKILPLHWAITVKTAGTDDAPVGNIYNAAGNIDTFFYESLFGVPLKNANWRGALEVGVIPQNRLSDVEQILSQVAVIRHDFNWNCQNWVWASLRELRHSGHEIKANLTWEDLVSEMGGLLEAWEDGDI